jgi:hypothetical protein
MSRSLIQGVLPIVNRIDQETEKEARGHKGCRATQEEEEEVGLERGPLSLVRVTKELLEGKSSGCGSRKPILTAVGIRCTYHEIPSIHKSWH